MLQRQKKRKIDLLFLLTVLASLLNVWNITWSWVGSWHLFTRQPLWSIFFFSFSLTIFVTLLPRFPTRSRFTFYLVCGDWMAFSPPLSQGKLFLFSFIHAIVSLHLHLSHFIPRLIWMHRKEKSRKVRLLAIALLTECNAFLLLSVPNTRCVAYKSWAWNSSAQRQWEGEVTIWKASIDFLFEWELPTVCVGSFQERTF